MHSSWECKKERIWHTIRDGAFHVALEMWGHPKEPRLSRFEATKVSEEDNVRKKVDRAEAIDGTNRPATLF